MATGSLQQRSPGSWSIVLYLGRNEHGKKKQKWVTFRGSKRAAQKELNRLLAELQSGTYVEPAKKTLGEYLEEQWLPYVLTVVEPKTYDFYRNITTDHLIPRLGRLELSRIKPDQIQAFYSEALVSGRKDGKGGLSAQSVKHLHRVLCTALNQAVEWELLTRNPAARVKPPRVDETERPTVNEEQFRQILEAAQDSWLYLPILLAGALGMRRGEVLGLRWVDLDLEVGALKVNHGLQHNSQEGLILRPPKRKSRRGLRLPTLLAEELRFHKQVQDRQREALGEAWQDSGFVVTRDDGRPRTPDNLTHAFLKLIRRLGYADFHFQDLRHSASTAWLEEGVPLKAVSANLGHSSVQITGDRYGHLTPRMEEQAAKTMDARLRRSLRRGDSGAAE